MWSTLIRGLEIGVPPPTQDSDRSLWRGFQPFVQRELQKEGDGPLTKLDSRGSKGFRFSGDARGRDFTQPYTSIPYNTFKLFVVFPKALREAVIALSNIQRMRSMLPLEFPNTLVKAPVKVTGGGVPGAFERVRAVPVDANDKML